MIAGGVENMSRAPFVMPKAESAFSRANAVYDTTIGWRFVNPLMKSKYGVDSMPETAENVAADFRISREDQDRMALASQLKAVEAQKRGFFTCEIVPVVIPQRKGEPLTVAADEHPRQTTLEALARLKGVVRADGTVTAGSARSEEHTSQLQSLMRLTYAVFCLTQNRRASACSIRTSVLHTLHALTRDGSFL